MLMEMGIKRGVNLGGWLSQCDYSEDRLNNFIKESDIEKIASWGLDHVRIPVDYNVVETEEGAYKPEGFARLDKAFAWCEKNGLKVVLDLHKTKGYSFDKGEKQVGFFDDEALQERFICLWEEFARRYGKMNDRIVFELLNEVTEERFGPIWNGLIKKTIERIRKIAPDTIILVGSYWNNSASSVHALEKPYDDKVVYNFHSYDPLLFTHQGAPWVDKMDVNFRQDFEDAGVTVEFFENFFAEAIAHAKKNNTVLYCGEYGVIDRAKPEDWVKWYQCINAVFEKHGIARAAWSYKEMDFGLSDARMDGVREELVKYL